MILYCDGASRGNPGPAAYGFILFENDQIIMQAGGKLGNTTNNVAEYEGLLHGVRKAIELGARSLVIKADSELMVRQLNGIYKVKTPHIKVLFEKAKLELKKLAHVEVLHVRREENSLADELCNLALDK